MLHAENVEAEPDQEIARVVHAVAAGDEIRRADDVARLLHAGRDVLAHVVDRGAGLECDELVAAQIGAEALGIGRELPGGAAHEAQHGAVARRDLADIVGAVETAGAVHVLDDDVGLALEMPGDMPREQPALDVGRAAGREVDQHRKPLAFVERLLRRNRRRRQHGRGNEREPDRLPERGDHGVSLVT